MILCIVQEPSRISINETGSVSSVWDRPVDLPQTFGTPQNQNVGHTACGISTQLGCCKLCVSGSGSVGSLIEM